jgi:hypothetical protein
MMQSMRLLARIGILDRIYRINRIRPERPILSIPFILSKNHRALTYER